MKKILNQLDEYMRYNNMENSLIHKNIKNAFKSKDFSTIYLDSKTYPVLKQQIFKLICEYEKNNKIIKPHVW